MDNGEAQQQGVIAGHKNMAKTLYICYFGLREPLVQTQVLPYLREIRKDGVEVSILTFEQGLKSNWTPEEIAAERDALASEGIDWHCLKYHKWPSVPATLYDVIVGTFFIRRFIAKNRPDILHGRVHLPTFMAALARKLSRRNPKLLFDIRGFFPEEYTDAGIWPEGGWLYRSVKRVESWLMSESNGFVVLTESAKRILFREKHLSGFDEYDRPIEVIPCCVDFRSRFLGNNGGLRSSVRSRLGIEDRFVLTHVGALGGVYRAKEIADFLAVARTSNPRSFAIFLTQTDPNLILPLLEERGFQESDYFVGRVSPTDVPGYLCASDVGLSFVKAGNSAASRSPTKIAEYLACGLPVVANRRVGDVDDLIQRNKIGALIEDFTEDAYLKALTEIEALGDIRQRCIETAVREFDISAVGGERYRRLYRRLLSSR